MSRANREAKLRRCGETTSTACPYAPAMRSLTVRLRARCAHRQRLEGAAAVPSQGSAEGAAEFRQHQRTDAVDILDTIDRRDMRMIQRRQEPRLPLEAHEPVPIREECRGQHFNSI